MGSPGLLSEALKRVLAIKLAEFTVMYHEELDRREVAEEEKKEVVTHTHTEIEDGDLLKGAIVAKRRKVGFGLPDTSLVNRVRTEVQANR